MEQRVACPFLRYCQKQVKFVEFGSVASKVHGLRSDFDVFLVAPMTCYRTTLQLSAANARFQFHEEVLRFLVSELHGTQYSRNWQFVKHHSGGARVRERDIPNYVKRHTLYPIFKQVFKVDLAWGYYQGDDVDALEQLDLARSRSSGSLAGSSPHSHPGSRSGWACG